MKPQHRQSKKLEDESADVIRKERVQSFEICHRGSAQNI